MLYRTYCIVKFCTGDDVQEMLYRNIVQEKVMHEILHRKCCAENIVQRKLVQEMLYRKTVQTTNVQDTSVNKTLGHAVHENMVQENYTGNIVQGQWHIKYYTGKCCQEILY